VKSDGDFADILAEDNPAIWESNRPAKGGDTGEAFEKIIARAVEIKAARTGGAPQNKKEKAADTPKKKAASKPSTLKRKSAANKK